MGLIKQAIEARVAAEAAERAGQPVVITIARDFGAEGHEIGKMLSTLLGIPLYDNELLVRSAMRAGESVDKLAAYDERMAAEFMAFLPDRRLSDYLLRNSPNHIAVLVTAPFDERVEIVRKKRGLNKREGAKLVREMQKARETFYKRYSAGKWKMTDGKDIVVNRAKLGRQGCVDVIAAAYNAKLRELGIYEEEVARVAEEAAAAAPLNVEATVEDAVASR